MKTHEPTFATAKHGELYRAPDGCLKRKPGLVATAPAVTLTEPAARPDIPKVKRKPILPGWVKLLKADMRAQYPAFAENLPLRIGVLKDLVDGGLGQTDARALLKHWTSRRKYHAAVAAGATRFNLDGTPAEPLLEKHRAYAAEKLKD